jgi:hypothetical protein
MSALFEWRPENVISYVTLNKTLEAHQTPVITTIDLKNLYPGGHARAVVDPLYRGQWSNYLLQLLLLLFGLSNNFTNSMHCSDNSQNWWYGAAIEVSLNASQLAWSQGEWSFVPIELFGIIDSNSIEHGNTTTEDIAVVTSANVTLPTSALRAWLDCKPIDEVANQSSWLQKFTLEEMNTYLWTNITELADGYQVSDIMFANTSSSTTASGVAKPLLCCANDTGSDPQRSVNGFWSPLQTNITTGLLEFPYASRQWPMLFVTKWIVGKPRSFINTTPLSYV